MPTPPTSEAFEKALRAEARTALCVDTPMPRAERLVLVRAFIARHTERLLAWHRQGVDARTVCRLRAQLFDALNRVFYALALKQAGIALEASPVSLLAAGGYGRRELSPHSDMDFMILFPENLDAVRLKKLEDAFTDQMLYPLWDLNVKVGQSLRTIPQAIEESKRDNFTKNSLLETRYLCGNRPLFAAFKKHFADYCAKDPLSYLRQRLDGAYERRKRFGRTVFLQEPEIKNGVGGLRDYQNLLWIVRGVFRAPRIEGAVTRGFLSADEVPPLKAAYAFLLRVRNEVHFESARPTDLLDLERQSAVALALGYAETDVFRRIERFMRDYYAAAHTVYRLCRLAEKRLERAYFPPPLLGDKGIAEDGFRIAGGLVFPERDDVFRDDPLRFIRVFRLAQRHRAAFDFSLETRMRDALELVTPQLALSPETQRCLREILQDRGNVGGVLAQMHALGLLGRFVPEFANLTGLVQHEHYHRYTADVHTLATVGRLDMLFRGEGDYAETYLRQLDELPESWLLYPALLLHDCGKADGIKGHSAAGVKIAAGALERLGLNSAQKDLVLYLVAHHMEMSRVCQRYDVEDPRTAAVFARQTETAARLRALFILTFCDANGTSSTLWNAYKQTLHRQLFFAALARLEGDGDAAGKALARAKERLRAALAPALADDGLSEDEVATHFRMMPEGYFLNATPDEVRRHLDMIHRLQARAKDGTRRDTLPLARWNHDETRGWSVLDVVTWDRSGLFFRLAGALAATGINILSTRALSREDGVTIDTFTVCEARGGAVKSPHAQTRFERALEDTFLYDSDLRPAIRAQAEQLARTYYGREKPVRTHIATQVRAYRESSLDKDVVEVRANDRIGLLYRIAQSIYEAGYDITFARIATERAIALDTFYVKAAGDGAAPSLEALRLRLNAALTSPA